MIQTDGTQPVMQGARCEELLVQQYWYRGQPRDAADLVLLKVSGTWYQLYLDGGVVHWRHQEEPPGPQHFEPGAEFSYPLVDVGEQFLLKGKHISDCLVEETQEGETVTLVFEQGVSLALVNHGDNTSIRYHQEV